MNMFRLKLKLGKNNILRRILLVIAVITLSATQSVAGSFERLKDGYGYVVIAVDTDTPPNFQELSFWNIPIRPMNLGLRVIKFDPTTKNLSYTNPLFNSPNEAQFYEVVNLANKKRYWVGQMKEGDAAIAMFYDRQVWGICFNSQTRYFHVTAGEFNLIGKFSAVPSFMELSKAAAEGKIPRTARRTETLPPLTNITLNGFTSAEDLPDLKAEVDSFFTEYTRSSVSTSIPKTLITDYNLGVNKRGQTDCVNYKR